jgi:hypothetical protein
VENGNECNRTTSQVSHWKDGAYGTEFLYRSPGAGSAKNKNSKNKNRNFEEIIFSKKSFLHGEKEDFEEYSLFLESAEFNFDILINYLAEENRPYPKLR